jgi:hypothetical protein
MVPLSDRQLLLKAPPSHDVDDGREEIEGVGTVGVGDVVLVVVRVVIVGEEIDEVDEELAVEVRVELSVGGVVGVMIVFVTDVTMKGDVEGVDGMVSAGVIMVPVELEVVAFVVLVVVVDGI